MKNNIIVKILIIIIISTFVILIVKLNIKKENKQYNIVNNITNEIQEEKKKEQKAVYFVEHKMQNTIIKGILKNNTNSDIKNVEISADCYDKDNNKLLTTRNYLTELKKGETWKFEMYTNSNAVRYKNLKVEYK